MLDDEGGDRDPDSVKLLLSFDPIPGKREAYFNYVLGEFIPTLEHLGLKMCEAWHTAYGSYPLRLTGFLADDTETLQRVINSDDFLVMEDKLQEYVVNYVRRVVPMRVGFQF